MKVHRAAAAAAASGPPALAASSCATTQGRAGRIGVRPVVPGHLPAGEVVMMWELGLDSDWGGKGRGVVHEGLVGVMGAGEWGSGALQERAWRGVGDLLGWGGGGMFLQGMGGCGMVGGIGGWGLVAWRICERKEEGEGGPGCVGVH